MGDADELSRLLVTFLFLTAFGIQHTECLQCYRCPATAGVDAQSANIDCLANGTETQCLPYQDRCYSYVEGESTIQKGCTMAEDCIGNRICCQTDFCNAGYGAGLQTGFGQPCQEESSCVQDEGMLCRRETAEAGQLSRCLCDDGWFPLGAACLRQSGVGELCFEDSHCRLLNSFCQYERCQCADTFFPSYTTDSCQLKLSILSDCNETVQCRARNSVCLQRCVCDIGYLYNPFTGHCSGACGVLWNTGLWTVIIFIAMASLAAD